MRFRNCPLDCAAPECPCEDEQEITMDDDALFSVAAFAAMMERDIYRPTVH